MEPQIPSLQGKWFIHYSTAAPSGLISSRVAQSVACLTTDAYLSADPGVASSIPAWSYTLRRLIMK